MLLLHFAVTGFPSFILSLSAEKEHFPRVTLSFTYSLESYLDRVKGQDETPRQYLGQKSFRWTVVVGSHTYTHS